MRVVWELTFSVLYDQFCMYIFYSTRSHTMVFEEIIKNMILCVTSFRSPGPGGLGQNMYHISACSIEIP